MRDKKTTLFIYSPYECSAVEEYLEIMAGKGWMIKSLRKPFFKFKRIEPRRLKFSVDIFEGISTLDPRNSEKALDYRAYCEAAGWEYVCQQDKIQVFYTEDYDKTIDIKTDNNEKFKAIVKSSLSGLSNTLFIAILAILNICIQAFFNIDGMITSNIGVLAVILTIAFIIYNFISLASFSKWAIKTKKILEDGRYIEYNTYKQLKSKNIFINLYAVLIGLGVPLFMIFQKNGDKTVNVGTAIAFIVVIILLRWVQYIKDNERFSKGTNVVLRIGAGALTVVITLAFFVGLVALVIGRIDEQKNITEGFNLRVSDFGYEEYDDRLISYTNSSILAEKSKYNYGDLLDYTVFNSNYKLAIKSHEVWLKNKLKKFDLDLIETKLPKEVKVYGNEGRTRYIISSDNRVLELYNRMKTDDEGKFLDIVYEKLLKEN
ncbi:DUF2812 domain-containing protein [Clostridium intestinale]|uniref:DUF2812 domain-containing protein n=1 Tax=Clostridium intestinale URNW TaxID=1294142 RepID=U2N0A0_9CLOT|nr:DUF2812 domain-containing protein [Clostridium intestinale]ERK28922.1 hypothetical protein CINTURNW_3804 [Clostridium intestinale URNW]